MSFFHYISSIISIKCNVFIYISQTILLAFFILKPEPEPMKSRFINTSLVTIA